MQAKPTKLPDDTWGVRVFDPGHADAWSGQAVTVQANGGKSWTSVLTEMVEHNEAKGFALYRKAEKGAKVKAEPQATSLFEARPPIAGGSSEADARLYVDVTYHSELPAPQTGSYGPFTSRTLAEQTLVAVAGRPDVKSAKVRNPEGGNS